MKYLITLFAAMWIAMPQLAAQEEIMLWRDVQEDCFAAVHPKQKMGIRDFAESFAKAHAELPLAQEIGEALESSKNREGISFILDKNNGYLSLSYIESSFIKEAEMCYWNLPDGRQRFCVNIQDVNEDEVPVFLIAFYGYDKNEGVFCFEEVAGREEMMDNLQIWNENHNLFLPRKGKDIKWGRNNGDEPVGWYRYRGAEGFQLERVEEEDDE